MKRKDAVTTIQKCHLYVDVHVAAAVVCCGDFTSQCKTPEIHQKAKCFHFVNCLKGDGLAAAISNKHTEKREEKINIDLGYRMCQSPRHRQTPLRNKT